MDRQIFRDIEPLEAHLKAKWGEMRLDWSGEGIEEDKSVDKA